MSRGMLSWLLVVAYMAGVVCQAEGVEVEVSADGSTNAASTCDEELATTRTQFVFSNPADDLFPPHAVYSKLPANQIFSQTEIFQLSDFLPLQAGVDALNVTKNKNPNVTTIRYSSWRDVVASAGKGSICKEITNPAVDSDTVFAAQRFNGIISQSIRLLNHEALTNFPSLTLTVLNEANEAIRPFDRHFNFKRELDQGNLYYVWYDELVGTDAKPQGFLGGVPAVPRYLPLPLAIFRFQEQELHPVLIQLSYDNNWFTYYPATENDRDYKKWSWLYAKLAFHVGEFNYHEPVRHSGTVHFILDPIIVATYRELCSSHPVFQLLYPHFDKTLTSNELIREDQLIGIIQAFDNPTRNALKEKAFANYRFRDSQIVNDLELRGFHVRTDRKGGHHLDDKFEFYSYARDQLAVWDAIYEFVEDVIKSQYSSDAAVASDLAVKNWAHVLASQIRIQQFPENILDIQTLVNTVTHIIWQTTGLHASVNYPQYWSFCAANYIGALYAPPLDPHEKSITESYVLSALPPIAVINLFVAVAGLGSSVPGQYKDYQATGQPITWVDTLISQYAQQGYHNVVPGQSVPKVPQYILKAISNFARNLKKVSDDIDARENDRHHTGQFSYRKYWWVNPKAGLYLANAIYL